jgi:Xaa-Pro dipeptidase
MADGRGEMGVELRGAFEPAFPREEFAARQQAVRERLAVENLDAGLFFSAESLFYLSGYEFPTHAAFQLLVVPVDGAPFLVTRQHMLSGIDASTWIDDKVAFPDTGDPIEAARQALIDRKLSSARFGIEEAALTLTVRSARTLAAALPAATFTDCSPIVERLRLVKSPREVAYMRLAARVSDAGIEAARAATRVGASERDIGIAATEAMMQAGGEYQAMPLLIGIEENSKLATPIWSSRKLGAGELLWIEVFGTIRRYATGLKATFGGAPASTDAEKRVETARLALARGIAAIAPGRPASVVPEAVQEVFKEAGYGETSHHQSGYSIGISFSPATHEARLLGLRQGNSTPLQAGMTLFPIANLYGPGATVSASATIVVTEDGAERLTGFEPRPDDLAR